MPDNSLKESPVDAQAESSVAPVEPPRSVRNSEPGTPEPVNTLASAEPEAGISPPMGADSAPATIKEPDLAKQPVGGNPGAGDTEAKRAKPRRKSGTGRGTAAVADSPEPTNLVELLVAMARDRNLEPTKRIVKGAKPTPALSQEHLASIRTTIIDDPAFAVPIAFVRAVLLSGPTKRALQQTLVIVEECLIARHLEHSSDSNRPTPDRSSDKWLLEWLVNIDKRQSTEAPRRRSPDSENLIRALVVLLAARDKIPSANIPGVVVKTDGKGSVDTRRADNPDDLERALDAMSFAEMARRDPLSHRALVAAARHIGEARAQVKRASAEKVALVQRCETAEERSRRLTEESTQSRAAAQELEKERDELQRALATARADADRAASTVRELTRSIAEVETRAAQDRERSEQRRIDDSNAYEALRAMTSRNRRKDLELLAEATAALEKDPPKPHVAFDRVSLVVKAMEKEREALRTQDEGNAAGPALE